ncbi:MAG: pyridoxamine 5'-phosphate oxidase family protein [Calditrichaeota bacterium]|nr:pyridoxamine 5'-phosphate oxidase family protein [Calditrichota bacterium]
MPLVEETQPAAIADDSLLAIAREVITAAGNCALITRDERGRPAIRAMDPFPPQDGLVVWLGTNVHSRKVAQIRANPRASLYYFDKAGGSYLTLVGTARIVEDPAQISHYWKPEWEAFYPDKRDYVLIKFIPERLEIISEKHGITGDPQTWRAGVYRLP